MTQRGFVLAPDEGAASADVLIGVGEHSTTSMSLDRGPPTLWHDVGVGSIFDDLPDWEFTVTEDSAGVYRVIAVRDGGIRGEGTGLDQVELLDDYKSWARSVESDLEERKLK